MDLKIRSQGHIAAGMAVAAAIAGLVAALQAQQSLFRVAVVTLCVAIFWLVLHTGRVLRNDSRKMVVRVDGVRAQLDDVRTQLDGVGTRTDDVRRAQDELRGVTEVLGQQSEDLARKLVTVSKAVRSLEPSLMSSYGEQSGVLGRKINVVNRSVKSLEGSLSDLQKLGRQQAKVLRELRTAEEERGHQDVDLVRLLQAQYLGRIDVAHANLERTLTEIRGLVPPKHAD